MASLTRLCALLVWLLPSAACAFGVPKPLPIVDHLAALPAFCVSERVIERDAYGQPIQEIRRSSDNATRWIYYLPNGMVDYFDELAFAGSGSAYEVQWNHQCSPRISATQSIDATQSAASNQPQIVASGLVESQNGVPAVYFGGANSLFTSSIAILGNNSNWTVAALASSSSSSVQGGIFEQDYGINPNRYFNFRLSNTVLVSAVRNTSETAFTASVTTGSLLLMAIFSNPTLNVYANGALGGTVSLTGSPQIGSTPISIGADSSGSSSAPLTGKITEDIGWAVSLGGADKTSYDFSIVYFSFDGVTQ